MQRAGSVPPLRTDRCLSAGRPRRDSRSSRTTAPRFLGANRLRAIERAPTKVGEDFRPLAEIGSDRGLLASPASRRTTLSLTQSRRAPRGRYVPFATDPIARGPMSRRSRCTNLKRLAAAVRAIASLIQPRRVTRPQWRQLGPPCFSSNSRPPPYAVPRQFALSAGQLRCSAFGDGRARSWGDAIVSRSGDRPGAGHMDRRLCDRATRARGRLKAIVRRGPCGVIAFRAKRSPARATSRDRLTVDSDRPVAAAETARSGRLRPRRKGRLC